MSNIDHHSIMQDLPHYRDRYEAAKKVNVYFVPAYDQVEKEMAFFYVLASAALHDKMVKSLESGTIPDFAVIVESGYGDPSFEVKDKIKTTYGFDHDLHANNDNIEKMQKYATAN